MQIGMVGLGRMGANMVRRLMRGGHRCVVFDVNPEAVAALAHDGATGAASLEAFAAQLQPPRIVWMMVPAAVVDTTLQEVARHLARGDILIDGGNSHYIDDIRRAALLAESGIHFVDVGTSGGVWGLERGFCLMVGGDPESVGRLDPLLSTLAPDVESAPRTPARQAGGAPVAAEHGYLHCGPHGAGHFVKMVHNGIEYGLMAAYAEGLNVLRHANAGLHERAADAETTPLRHPEHFQYEFNLADIAEVWRRGSVVASWLLDLTADALAADPALQNFSGEVADSGEGRWTVSAAIEEGVPTHVLSAALYERFASRGQADFANRVLSAMRFQFGGHRQHTQEKK
jgi:6-phosphogluconate dehydrogenase